MLTKNILSFIENKGSLATSFVEQAKVVSPKPQVTKEAPRFVGQQIKKLPGVRELPEYKDWRMFSVQSSDTVRKTLKKVDNALSWLRSIGKDTPEMSAITIRGEKEIVQRARIVEKLLESIEKKAYQLAKNANKMYDTKLTSPAFADVNANAPAKADRPTFVMFFMFISIFMFI